ncbi:helix-turn-helix domain-containing protein [Bradyrhizobium sp. 41S5]|nr:helix-turn-helix domain-containing protein [Bradyrhizobium sp. 41S5]UFX42247.1 helix-turn-helix domain-containing protein [Bradyrhizobium sp. 41S5]
MGQCYGQLSLEERVEIYRLHAGGKSQNDIASAPRAWTALRHKHELP